MCTAGQRWTGAYVGLPGCLAFALVETTGAPANTDGGASAADSVVVEEGSVVGYTLAALSSSTFYPEMVREWLPTQAAKYTQPTGEQSGWSDEEKAIAELYASFSSFLYISIFVF